jgi:putative endonuclease
MKTPMSAMMWANDGTLRTFAVYIMSNVSMTLYTGVTGDLPARSMAHKKGEGSRFTSNYHFDRMVYFEVYESVVAAITREKQIKGLTRAKKIAMIKSMNPEWGDITPEGR